MIVLKIDFFKIRFCEKSDFDEAKRIVCGGMHDTSAAVAATELFSKNRLSYALIADLVIPEDTGIMYCDKILKSIRIAQKQKSDIVLMNDLAMIDHSGDAEGTAE